VRLFLSEFFGFTFGEESTCFYNLSVELISGLELFYGVDSSISSWVNSGIELYYVIVSKSGSSFWLISCSILFYSSWYCGSYGDWDIATEVLSSLTSIEVARLSINLSSIICFNGEIKFFCWIKRFPKNNGCRIRI
jgi:hypothetical protein